MTFSLTSDTPAAEGRGRCVGYTARDERAVDLPGLVPALHTRASHPARGRLAVARRTRGCLSRAGGGNHRRRPALPGRPARAPPAPVPPPAARALLGAAGRRRSARGRSPGRRPARAARGGRLPRRALCLAHPLLPVERLSRRDRLLLRGLGPHARSAARRRRRVHGAPDRGTRRGPPHGVGGRDHRIGLQGHPAPVRRRPPGMRRIGHGQVECRHPGLRRRRGAGFRGTVRGLLTHPEAPPIDLLVVPGGFGTRTLLHDEPTLGWIRRIAASALKVTSVCTGALLLAQAGLLDGRRATTHWGALELLESLDKGAKVERDVRVVDDGIITSAGVASGLDMALYVVEMLVGRAVADETARYIELRKAS